MWIKSQFKDYYDKQQVYATSDNFTFIRNIIVEEPPKQFKNTYRGDIKCLQIGFCGQIYHILYIPEYNPDEDMRKFWRQDPHPAYVFYSIEEYQALYKSYRVSPEERRKMSPFFKIEKDDSLFIKYNCPVFIRLDNIVQYHTLGRPYISTNKSWYDYEFKTMGIYTLQRFEFDRIKPASLAYMEIEGYINGVLGAEHKEIPEMTNEVKIESHGFDKRSFKHR